MKKLIFGLAVTVLSVVSGAAHAQPSVVTSAAWRADLAQLDAAIRSTHPRPFYASDEERYAELVTALERDIESLVDKEIIIRMAHIVASVRDGHTRLAIPREHPDLGVAIGHSGTEAPHHARLLFRQLPIAFEAFSDGVFVVAAMREHADLIGHRLLALGETPADVALERAKSIAYAENDQFASLLGADRLSMPEALAALGVIEANAAADVTLEDSDGRRLRIRLDPMPPGNVDWVRARPSISGGDRQSIHERRFLPDRNIVYVKLSEIADAKERLATFIVESVAEAEARDARLVLDLRENFGGQGDLNRTAVLAIIQSEELNQYGKTFVLIGKRTFSAAQMLANTLETYSRVLFVGEGTGARPDHFGDARKIRLENSGLTLRVSTLHWSSLFAGDRRETLSPDIPASWTSDDYFSGGDPALDAIERFEDASLKALLRGALLRDDHYQIGRYLLSARLFPDTYANDFSPILLELGRDLEADGETEAAGFAYRYGLAFYPDNAGLAAALEGLE